MRILVTFAVEAEFAPWRKLREFKKRPADEGPTLQRVSSFKTTFGDNDVEVLLTGIGNAACGVTLAKNSFLQDGKPDLVISSGLAGALKERLKPGDLIVPLKARPAFFGEAVDMESAIIMSHFAAANVAVLTIRAVSDAADEDLPIDFDRCLTPQGAIKPMSLVNAIVRRPSKLPNLVRFGRQSNQAAQRLATFLDEFIAAMPVAQEKVATV